MNWLGDPYEGGLCSLHDKAAVRRWPAGISEEALALSVPRSQQRGRSQARKCDIGRAASKIGNRRLVRQGINTFPRATQRCDAPEIRDAEALARRLTQKYSVSGVPAELHGHHEAIVLFRNLLKRSRRERCRARGARETCASNRSGDAHKDALRPDDLAADPPRPCRAAART
jgi:hypothetical protein